MRQHEQHASLISTRGAALPVLERVCIHATATAPLLEVLAEQHYVNASRQDLEVVYTFPVPPRAVLLGLEFVLGERTLTGTVQARKAASETYDRAVGERDSAVLVEAQRDGLYTANLGNLRPGERARIRIRYGQLLEAQGDEWRIDIPTVLAPFYGDAERDGGLDPRVAPTQCLAADYPLELTLTLPGRADAATLRCTSHEAAIEAASDAVVARLPESARLDRDVVFLARRAPHGTALSGPDGERAIVVATTVLQADAVEERPVSVRLVLDCSGSMAGESMDWAAVGCQRLVEGLRDEDEFSVTRFGSDVDHWTRRVVPASASNRAEFARRLLNVAADLGGTEMEQALRGAAGLRSRRERSEIVLLTDGEIWASDALVRWARGAGVRVFVIGVGAAPNQPFLARLAEETGGTCELVSPGEDMIRAVQRVLERLRQPRGEGLTVAWPAAPDWTLQLPAVAYAGQAVHVIAGFEAAPMGEVTVAGARIAVPGHVAGDDLLSRIAAYQRLLSGHFENPAAAAEHYQLVTEWTSLVAVVERADADKASSLPQIVRVNHMLAAGWGGTGHSALMSRSAPPVVAFRVSASEFEANSIPSFLRVSRSQSAAARKVRDPLSDTDFAEPVAQSRRQVSIDVAAVRRHREELGRWLRAIKRRIVVESLSEHRVPLTLHWLSACIPPNAVALLKHEADAGIDEQALVATFILDLGSLEDDIGEGLTETALLWVTRQLSEGTALSDNRVSDSVAHVLNAFMAAEDGRLEALEPGAESAS